MHDIYSNIIPEWTFYSHKYDWSLKTLIENVTCFSSALQKSDLSSERVTALLKEKEVC